MCKKELIQCSRYRHLKTVLTAQDKRFLVGSSGSLQSDRTQMKGAGPLDRIKKCITLATFIDVLILSSAPAIFDIVKYCNTC